MTLIKAIHRKIYQSIGDIPLAVQYNIAKSRGIEVKYLGSGSAEVSNLPLWSEWYQGCCGVMLFADGWASLSHRGYYNDGYKPKEDIISNMRSLASATERDDISNLVTAFAVGGSEEHIHKIMDSLKSLEIPLIGDGFYISEPYDAYKGLVVIPEKRKSILCETSVILTPKHYLELVSPASSS